MGTKSKLRTVLVTGADGFVGKNLIAQLQLTDDVVVKKVTRQTTNLKDLCKDIDFVFHLAAENRPADEKDFQKVNVGFTEALLTALSAQKHPIPIALSSSTQAALDNPYGISKKKAEDLVFDYGTSTESPVYVFRLTNIFGKWTRPNYNSVVATFCHNLVRNLPLQINAPDHELELIHIDDVVRCLIECMDQKAPAEKQFVAAGPTHKITLGKLAKTLQTFWESRTTQVLPDLSIPFHRALYGTLSSYYEMDKLSVKPQLFSDDRGWLFELVKSKYIGQIFVSSTRPGYTRGDHWHHTKVEKFTVIKGSGKLSFRHISSDEIITYELSDKQIEIVDIPTGYIHAITNDGKEDMLVLFWASEVLDKDRPDTYYEKVKR